MKNSVVLFSWLTIFFVSHFLFSCKTSIEVEKRYYRSGYFLNIGSGKRHVKKALDRGIEAVVKDTIGTPKETGAGDNSAIFKNDTSGILMASIENVLPPIKDKPVYSITPSVRCNSATSINQSQKSRHIFKMNKKRDTNTPPPHNTGKILRIIGTIVELSGF
jgi:hypothetical protein